MHVYMCTLDVQYFQHNIYNVVREAICSFLHNLLCSAIVWQESY